MAAETHDSSPMSSALKLKSLIGGGFDIQRLKSGPIGAVKEEMDVEEFRHLLVLMATITVISFVLVVAVVTILLLFLWRNRRKSAHNCEECCCKVDLRSVQPTTGGVGYQKPFDGHDLAAFQHGPYSGFEAAVPPHHFFMPGLPPQIPPYRSPVPAYRSPVPSHHSFSGGQSVGRRLAPTVGDVIVNPLPPLASMGPLPPAPCVSSDVSGFKVSDGGSSDPPTEPIYAEIKSPAQQLDKTLKSASIDVDDKTATDLKSPKELQPEVEFKKKEVEYWQITAKEVIKFRPCTETFIHRA